jgi:hypothetical protein
MNDFVLQAKKCSTAFSSRRPSGRRAHAVWTPSLQLGAADRLLSQFRRVRVVYFFWKAAAGTCRSSKISNGSMGGTAGGSGFHRGRDSKDREKAKKAGDGTFHEVMNATAAVHRGSARINPEKEDE